MSLAGARVGVVGATGYVGGEAARWLLAHPQVELSGQSQPSRSSAGCSDAGSPGNNLEVEAFDAETGPAGCRGPGHPGVGHGRLSLIIDVPQTTGMRWLDLWGTRVEYRRLKTSRRIAAPGCFATAIALSLAPWCARIVEGVTAAATGSTTGCVSSGDPHPERFTNLKAYKVLDHQHVPEIQSLDSRDAPEIAFVPYLRRWTVGFWPPAVPCAMMWTLLLQQTYATTLDSTAGAESELRLAKTLRLGGLPAGDTVAVLCHR